MLTFLRPGPSDKGNARAYYRCSCGYEALVRVGRVRRGEQEFCDRWCSARVTVTPEAARASGGVPSWREVDQVRREAYRSALRGGRFGHNLPANPTEVAKCSKAFADALRERGWLHQEGYAR